MKAKTLVLSLILSLAFAGQSFAQTTGGDRANEGYDRTGFDEPGQLAGTSLVQDLDEIKKRAIENIINRVRKGDPNVLKYVVYDVFTEVHKAVLQESRERTSKSSNSTPISYYDVIGGKAALPSFYGCFDNQDPKVRLRCIGFLGDWIDDIGIGLNDIGRQASDRLNSRIETRIEVYYGYVLLTLKVFRKLMLNQIWNGDEDVLRTIDPRRFVVLVHDEPFIREMFCIPRDVKLRSIRLLPWWLDTFDDPQGGGSIYWYRTKGDEETERQLTNQYTPFRSLSKELELRLKVNDDKFFLYRNYGGIPAKVLAAGDRKTQGYGYQDPAKYQDIASLYDLRYFRYSNQTQLNNSPFQNEERYVPAIFAGLENPSLFVRENVARLLVRLSDGPVGFVDRETANYDAIRPSGGTNGGLVSWGDENSTQRTGSRMATPYELLDDTNNVIGVQGMISRMAKNSKYQQTLRNAWTNAMFSQYMDVHESGRGSRNGNFPAAYNPTEGVRLSRNVPFSPAANAWGYKYNYRTDLADLMRRFNLGREIEFCDRREVQATASTGGQFFVEDLFDLDEQSRVMFPGSNVQVPLWHGKDEIKDEVFEP